MRMFKPDRTYALVEFAKRFSLITTGKRSQLNALLYSIIYFKVPEVFTTKGKKKGKVRRPP